MPFTDSRRTRALSAVALVLWWGAVLIVALWKWPASRVQPHEWFERAEVARQQQRVSESLASIDRAVEADPDNGGYLVFRGWRQLDLGDASGAEESFWRAVSRRPSDAEATLGLAAALARQNRKEVALDVLRAAPTEALTEAQLQRRSQLEEMLGAREQALEDVSLLLQARPHDPELLSRATSLAVALEDWPRAVSLAERLGAATNDPEVRRRAATTRGVALHRVGRQADAYAALQAGADADQLETRAYLAVQLGRHGEAADLYKELVAKHPAEPRFRRSLAIALHEAGRRDEAETIFRAIVADGAADEEIRRVYAWLLNSARRYAEAWHVIEPLPRPAGDAALLELQARTALWAGQLEDAAQLFHALTNVRPADAELWKRLAEIWDALGVDSQTEAALRAYIRLQSQDWRARRRLAEIMATRGSLAAALDEYRRLSEEQPDDFDTLQALGILQETSGDLDSAIATFRRAIEVKPDTDVYLRIGRLHRWTGRSADAVQWYERYLAGVSDVAKYRRGEIELAQSLFEAGDARAALARLQASGDRSPLDAEELVTAARAATALRQPATAAHLLEAIGERRPLTPNEREWLANQYRAADQRPRALAAFEEIAAAGLTASPQIYEAIADLRADGGDFMGALRALRSIDSPSPAVTLKLARAAAKSGDWQVADQAYERYLRSAPEDAAALLEAARYYASTGRPQTALDHYQRVIDARGGDRLRIELARTNLAAGRFHEAEPWARQALAAGEDAVEAQLALGQSLHLQGRHKDADAVLALLSPEVDGGEGLVWRGRAAVALDRHLEAYRIFELAIASGAPRPDQLLLWMGSAAEKRGDYARAQQAYGRARAAGAAVPEVQAAEQGLRAATAPSISVPVWVHADSNGLSLSGAASSLRLFLPGSSAALVFGAAIGRVSQGRFISDRTAFSVGVGQLFLVPELQLEFALGLNRFTRGPDLVTWRVGSTYWRGDTAALGVAASREPLLPLSEGRDLRRFNRVLDVESLGPAFHVDNIEAFLNLRSVPGGEARIEIAAARAADGNRRLSSYMHYQFPLSTAVGHWTVLRPNVFFETFRETQPLYFSPRRHLTLGTMFHTVQQLGRAQLEFEINPQLLRTDGASGLGAHGLFNVLVRAGRARLAGGTFVFYDGLEDYLQWRVGGQLTVPIGR